MLFLIPWFLLLAFVLLVVPIVALIEKKKRAALFTPSLRDDEPMGEDAVFEEVPLADGGDLGSDFGEAAEVGEMGADDFSAFDDQLK